MTGVRIVAGGMNVYFLPALSDTAAVALIAVFVTGLTKKGLQRMGHDFLGDERPFIQPRYRDVRCNGRKISNQSVGLSVSSRYHLVALKLLCPQEQWCCLSKTQSLLPRD